MRHCLCLACLHWPSRLRHSLRDRSLPCSARNQRDDTQVDKTGVASSLHSRVLPCRPRQRQALGSAGRPAGRRPGRTWVRRRCLLYKRFHWRGHCLLCKCFHWRRHCWRRHCLLWVYTGGWGEGGASQGKKLPLVCVFTGGGTAFAASCRLCFHWWGHCLC